MTQYSIADARKHLPALVDEVAAGNDVQLTRRGKAVAVVVSVAEYQRLRAGLVPFAVAYARFLERFPEGLDGNDPEYFDSLRDRSPGREVEL